MLRAWGRVPDNSAKGYSWVPVVTDPVTGDNTAVRLTQLIQVLKMERNESPMYANFGIPARQSVIQRVAPDIFVAQTQQQFSSFFASLIISRLTGAVNPTYLVNIVTFTGQPLSLQVPV